MWWKVLAVGALLAVPLVWVATGVAAQETPVEERPVLRLPRDDSPDAEPRVTLAPSPGPASPDDDPEDDDADDDDPDDDPDDDDVEVVRPVPQDADDDPDDPDDDDPDDPDDRDD
jgi:hypothetical protein